MSRTIGRFVLATLLLAGFAVIGMLVGYTNGVNGIGHFDWDTFWGSFGIFFTGIVPLVIVIVVLAVGVGLTLVLIRASHAVAIVAVWLALAIGIVIGVAVISKFGWDWVNQTWPIVVLLVLSGLVALGIDFLGPFLSLRRRGRSEESPKTNNSENES